MTTRLFEESEHTLPLLTPKVLTTLKHTLGTEYEQFT